MNETVKTQEPQLDLTSEGTQPKPEIPDEAPVPAEATKEPVQESPAPTRSGQVTPDQMLELAIEKGADLEQLEKLMDLRERWEATEARKAYVQAMGQFRRNAPTIPKNRHVKYSTSNGMTDFWHASLDKICEVIGPVLAKYGMNYHWETSQEEGLVHVTCFLTHELGHSTSVTLSGAPDKSGSKNSIQAVGSVVTYLQRYTLLAVTGMATDDDDDGAGAGSGDSQDKLGDDTPKLTGEQVERLRNAIKVTGKTEEQFCRKAQINRLEDLQPSRFERTLEWLRKQAHGGDQQ